MEIIKSLAWTASWMFVTIGMLTMPLGVRSWSFPNTHSNTGSNTVSSRRQLLQQTTTAAVASAVAIATATTTPRAANAACLQGDTRPVCIGIYKVPQDDSFQRYFSTPEQLRDFAPDLLYVAPTPPPKSFENALEVLRGQRLAAETIQKSVAAGRLEEAGVGLLGLIPTVSISGRFVVDELETRVFRKQQKRSQSVDNDNNNDDNNDNDGYDENGYKSATTADELAVDMASNQMDYVNGYFGECDICIGQGLRGELGVSAVAQLTILSTLRDATGALDDFLVTASVLGAKM
uniref:Uncharacterized protein n=1 Tax=Pseudo-nitzschia australis TaxID=44445 RepID=A0A7S4ANX5_9STRA|mmetsp:Transcript_19811/g.42978  ORF Transcript_19811/g.42978 Transcript_19811/m.42978 type:complete len:291 (-) Transcript_19811:398-1270(-)